MYRTKVRLSYSLCTPASYSVSHMVRRMASHYHHVSLARVTPLKTDSFKLLYISSSI